MNSYKYFPETRSKGNYFSGNLGGMVSPLRFRVLLDVFSPERLESLTSEISKRSGSINGK